MMKRLRRKVASALPRLARLLRISSKRPQNTSDETTTHYASPLTPGPPSGPSSVPLPASVPPHTPTSSFVVTNHSPWQPGIPDDSYDDDADSISLLQDHLRRFQNNELRPSGFIPWDNRRLPSRRPPPFEYELAERGNQTPSPAGSSSSPIGSVPWQSAASTRDTAFTRDEEDASPPNSFCTSQCSSPGNPTIPLPPEHSDVVTSEFDYENLMKRLKSQHSTENTLSNAGHPNAPYRGGCHSASTASSLGVRAHIQVYPCDLCSERFRHRVSLSMHSEIHSLEERIHLREQDVDDDNHEDDNTSAQ
ncbi:hypothetical protein FRC18_010192 [Serendipita sp. 400]|nr:hypothetical protein FRC18_010192 [Serendipita sp. 400]